MFEDFHNSGGVQAIQLLKEQKVNVGIASTITKQNYLELAAIGIVDMC